MCAHSPQQRVLANRKQEPPREALPWAAAKGKTEMVDNALQPRGATRERSGDPVIEPLGEYLPPATRIAASKSLHLQADANATAMRRQVGQTPPVSAVDPRRYAAARRTRRHRRSRSSDGDNLATAYLDVLDPETGRQQ